MTDKETYSAKQVATRIGTDAKTLRKFFRSSASPFDSVGQGGRYEFPAADLPKIQKAFTTWLGNKNIITASTPKPRSTTGPVNGKVRPPRRQKHKVDVEPGEHRALPYKPKPTKLNATEFAEERAARGKARDEEYDTVDGLTNEEIEALAITEAELRENIDAMNEAALEDLEFDDEELELDDEDEN